jgi:membrane associated rhomboid family serine protease
VLDVLPILALLVVVGFVLRGMTSAERARLGRAVIAFLLHAKDGATHRSPKSERLRDALRARTRWALVTPALVALNVTIFVLMIFGAGALNDPATLVGWGGNFGPRTANGEWWRLVTSMFVHAGILHLLINVVALIQVGLILERLLGQLTFAAMYFAAGVFAGLVNLSTHPIAVSVGASGAIFGLYGLFLASLIWGMLPCSSVTIPVSTLKKLWPAAAVFILYNASSDRLANLAELTSLIAGFVYGLVLARGISERKPPGRRLAVAMGATVAIVVAFAIPLSGVIDVRPEIERLVTVEDRTAGAYEAAVERFKKGRITAEALTQLIDRTIVPELQAADARLRALNKVPEEHKPLVAGAEEYVRLRSESWRLRAEGLRKVNTVPKAARTGQVAQGSVQAEARYQATMRTLGQAEATERASLEALQKIRPDRQEVTKDGVNQPLASDPSRR